MSETDSSAGTSAATETDPSARTSAATETDSSAGERSSPAALVRDDVVSTAPLRSDARLLGVAPVRTPVLGSTVDSWIDSWADSWADSRVDAVLDAPVADAFRLSDTAAVARRHRDE